MGWDVRLCVANAENRPSGPLLLIAGVVPVSWGERARARRPLSKCELKNRLCDTWRCEFCPPNLKLVSRRCWAQRVWAGAGRRINASPGRAGTIQTWTKEFMGKWRQRATPGEGDSVIGSSSRRQSIKKYINNSCATFGSQLTNRKQSRLFVSQKERMEFHLNINVALMKRGAMPSRLTKRPPGGCKQSLYVSQ